MSSFRGGLGALAFALVVGAAGCLPSAGNGGDGGGPEACDLGERRCECRDDGTCDDGLVCSAAKLCLDALCRDGQPDCPCGEGDTCDEGLVCNGLLCVSEGEVDPPVDAGGDAGGVEDVGPGEDTGGDGQDAGEDAGEDAGGGEDVGPGEDAGVDTPGLSGPTREVFSVTSANEEARGDVRFTNTGETALTIERVRLTPEGDAFAFANALPTPFVLAEGAGFDVPLVAQSGFGDAMVELSVDVSELDEPVVVELERKVNTPANFCPNAVAVVRKPGGPSGASVQVVTGARVELDGFSSTDPDGSVARYEWSLVGRPSGSSATLTPSASVALTNLITDTAGTYTVELLVYDDQGLVSCSAARVVVTATVSTASPDEVVINLTWDTPGDLDQADMLGSDMDIHYLFKTSGALWDRVPWDIYWNNKTSDWGVVGNADDDPVLEIDDIDGVGPERVRHEGLVTGEYFIGVYYYNDNGFGPSTATLSVTVGGVEQFNPPLTMYMPNEDRFWTAAKLTVAANGAITVTSLNRPLNMGIPTTQP